MSFWFILGEFDLSLPVKEKSENRLTMKRYAMLYGVLMLIVFVILALWILSVYVSKTYYDATASAGQILLYVIMICLILPGYFLFGKIILSRQLSKKLRWTAMIDKPALSRQEWMIWFGLHLLGAVFLFLVFAQLEHHLAIRTYLIELFGRTSRGAPAFPIMLAAGALPCLVIGGLYLLFLKIHGFWSPYLKHADERPQLERQNAIMFSFMISTGSMAMICTQLIWIVTV